jgi:G3E family GTPase
MDTKEEKGGNKVPPSNSNDIVSCNEDGAHDDDDVPPTLIDLSRNDDKVSSSFASATPQLLVRKEPCPLTILSGFLGAGKTTLIQYILQSPDHGKRIAVIENEYGGDDDNKSTDTPNEITNSRNLRVESLIAQDGLALQDEDVKRNLLDMIELPNGCVCCTVKDKLVQTLEALLQARPDLDYILLECSGMANPGPLATTFWLDDALESQLRLDGIVTLVDAKYIEKQLDTTIEASQQIAYADRILINKADLFVHNENTKEGTDPLHRVQERILRLNPLAEMKTCTYSRIPDLSWILDAQLFDPNRFDATISLENEHDHCHDHNHVHDNDFSNDCEKCAHNHAHTDAISTITLHYDGCIQSLDVLNRWLAELLWPDQDGHSSLQATATSTNTMSILRLKGIVAIPNHREHYIVQAVYDTWQVTPAKTATFATDADKACQLIVIGKHLNETMLRAGFQNCLAWYEK